jgi:hypothetical protein
MKGANMKARIVDGIKYRSNSDYAKYLLKNSHETGLSDSDIARMAKITPQTVHSIKNKMLTI